MKKKYRSFEEARKFCKKLKLDNRKEWLNFCKSDQKPKDIPIYPDTVYKNDGWKGWGDWVGSGVIANKDREYLPFDKARNFVKNLKLKNKQEWIEYYRSGNKPENIPSIPERTYNKKWIGYWDWLGIKKPITKEDYLPFDKARKIIHGFKIKGHDDWSSFLKSGKKPNNIPSVPERIYKNDGWKGWGDWVGTGRIANKNKRFWTYEKSKTYIQKLHLNQRKDFTDLVKEGKIPKDIPNTPDHIYKKTREWVSWGDFLGTGYVHPVEKSKNRPNFEQARKEAQSLAKKYNLKSWDDWIKAHKEGKIPSHLPQRPDKIFAKRLKK